MKSKIIIFLTFFNISVLLANTIEEYFSVTKSPIIEEYTQYKMVNNGEFNISSFHMTLRSYKRNSGDVIISSESILNNFRKIINKEKLEKNEETTLLKIIRIFYYTNDFLLRQITIKELNFARDKILIDNNGYVSNILYVDFPSLYIRKKNYGDALELLQEGFKNCINVSLLKSIFEIVETIPNNQDFYLHNYPLFVSKIIVIISKKEISQSFFDLLSHYSKYNKIKYDGVNRIKIKEIINGISDQEFSKINVFTNKTFRQYADELGLFSINPIVDKKSNVKENGNNFTSNVFIVLGVLFLAIFGGFLIKNRKKKDHKR